MSPHPLPSNPSAPPSIPGSDRLGTLIGDRICITCGYNLVNQPLVREPHYQMIIARCPECGTVASLQEYPLLGRWANRWSWLFAALWVLFLLAFFAATAGSIYGISYGAGYVASERLGDFIAAEYRAHLEEQRKGLALDSAGNIAPASLAQAAKIDNEIDYLENGYGQPDSTWSYDLEATLAANGGYQKVINWRALAIWQWLAFAAFIYGVIWSVLLPHLRGRSCLLIPLVYLAILGLICAALWIQSEPARMGSLIWFAELGAPLIRPLFTAASVLFALCILSLGLILGRRIARLLVRIFLHPRWRGPFAFLWHADHLSPPILHGSGRMLG